MTRYSTEHEANLQTQIDIIGELLVTRLGQDKTDELMQYAREQAAKRRYYQRREAIQTH